MGYLYSHISRWRRDKSHANAKSKYLLNGLTTMYAKVIGLKLFINPNKYCGSLKIEAAFFMKFQIHFY